LLFCEFDALLVADPLKLKVAEASLWFEALSDEDDELLAERLLFELSLAVALAPALKSPDE